MFSTFKEKAIYFQLEQVNDLDSLKKIVMKLENNDSFRFRGVNEAKYSMLSTLQRDGHGKDFFANLLMAVKTDKRVKELFDIQNIKINDLSCLSLMQHYRLPTPLIDFTTDIKTALSFASTGITKDSICNWETEDYVSLYYFSLNEERELNNYLQIVLNNDTERGIAYAKEFLGSGCDLSVSELQHIDTLVSWYQLSTIEMIFVENPTWAERVRTISGEVLDLKNPNITKQKGCFVLNNYREPNLPLEKNWYCRTAEYRNKFYVNSGIGNEPLYSFSGLHTNGKIHCVDINKEAIIHWNNENPIDPYDNSYTSEIISSVLQDIYASVEKI